MARQSEYGPHEFSEQRAVPTIKVVNYDFEDLDATAHTLKIPIKANTFIRDITHLVTTAFAGGTPALTIGDATDADGYGSLAAAKLDTIGDVYASKGAFVEDAGGVATSVPYAAGKMYSAGSYLVLTHAADLSAGAAKLMIEMIEFDDNWRMPNL